MRALQLTGAERETWLRAALGIAQLTAGIWLIVLWLIGASSAALVALVLLSFGIFGFRWWHLQQGGPNRL